jgi:hypothetical protein
MRAAMQGGLMQVPLAITLPRRALMVRTDLATSRPEGHFDTGVKSSALFARADSILGVIRDAAGGVLTHA